MTRPPPLCAFCLVAAAVACGGPNAADVDPCQDSDASRAAFASEVAAALQGLPDAPRFRYEAADFRLVEAVEGGAPRLIELARARNEWCAGDAEQRARILTQLAALAVRARSVPSSFESARRELLPAMRSRMYAVSADRMVAAMPMKSLAGRPIAEHLWLALVVDRPGHLL